MKGRSEPLSAPGKGRRRLARWRQGRTKEPLELVVNTGGSRHNRWEGEITDKEEKGVSLRMNTEWADLLLVVKG